MRAELSNPQLSISSAKPSTTSGFIRPLGRNRRERRSPRVRSRRRHLTYHDVQGRVYIDGISGLWVVNAGTVAVKSAAMAEQASSPLLCFRRFVHHRSRHQARRQNRRTHASGLIEPRFLLVRWIGSGRIGRQDRQAGPGDARIPAPLQNHRPPRFLPRYDPRRDDASPPAAMSCTSARSCTACRTRRRTSTAQISAFRTSRPISARPAKYARAGNRSQGAETVAAGHRRADLDLCRCPRTLKIYRADASRDLRSPRRCC